MPGYTPLSALSNEELIRMFESSTTLSELEKELLARLTNRIYHNAEFLQDRDAREARYNLMRMQPK